MSLLRTAVRVRRLGTGRPLTGSRIGYRTSKIGRRTANSRRTRANNQPSFKRLGL